MSLPCRKCQVTAGTTGPGQQHRRAPHRCVKGPNFLQRMRFTARPANNPGRTPTHVLYTHMQTPMHARQQLPPRSVPSSALLRRTLTPLQAPRRHTNSPHSWPAPAPASALLLSTLPPPHAALGAVSGAPAAPCPCTTLMRAPAAHAPRRRGSAIRLPARAAVTSCIQRRGLLPPNAKRDSTNLA